MNVVSFLRSLKNLITSAGDGFYRSIKIPLTDLKTAAGLTLTAGTNPLLAALETNHVGLQWAASNSTAALLNITLPLDYDQTADLLEVVFLCNSAGNTDAPTLTATAYKKRFGTALSVDLAPTASNAIPKSATAATAAGERKIVFSAKGLKARDVLTILVAPGAHTTDAVNVYGVEVRYRSTLVGFLSSDR